METLETIQESAPVEQTRKTGKVTKVHPESNYGFIRTDAGDHYFFHKQDSPALSKIPDLGSWVSFTPVEQDGRRRHSRAIRVEVL